MSLDNVAISIREQFSSLPNIPAGASIAWTGWVGFSPSKRNHLVNAPENFDREENLSPILIATKAKDMDQQVKVSHKVTDVLDWANKKFSKTLLRYIVDNPESSDTQVRLIVKKEDEKFQQSVYVSYKLKEILYLLLQWTLYMIKLLL